RDGQRAVADQTDRWCRKRRWRRALGLWRRGAGVVDPGQLSLETRGNSGGLRRPGWRFIARCGGGERWAGAGFSFVLHAVAARLVAFHGERDGARLVYLRPCWAFATGFAGRRWHHSYRRP